MKSDERKKVRPVAQTSMADKVFKPLVSVARRVGIPKEHPLVVLIDLCRGSLKSLDRYLAKHGGIADREIAVELRKLIAGSASRTKFRLLVVEHPGRKSKGGAPRTGDRAPSAAERDVAEQYESLEHFGKTAAAAEVALKTKRSESTVRQARDRVQVHKKRVAIEVDQQIAADTKTVDLQGRRETALQSLGAARESKD